MSEQDRNPEQNDGKGHFKEDPFPKPPTDYQLKPVEDTLRDQGYPQPIIENYSRMALKDIHLAEIYRRTAKGSPAPTPGKVFNPLQVKVDRKGQVWVDVMLEKKAEVKIRDLRRLMKVYGNPKRDQIITGRIKVDNLPDLYSLTMNLQTARPVFPALNRSVKSISANKQKLTSEEMENINGSNVIIGIIDNGCAFNHPNFKTSNNKTRLISLWYQNGKVSAGRKHPPKYSYGVEYTEEIINKGLPSSNDNSDTKALYTDSFGYKLEMGAHGTYVMDIAAGSSPDQDFLGVAPGAKLIFVDIGMPSSSKVIDKELGAMASSKCLLDAVNYIFEKAGNIPTVINISLAGNGGAHDGTSLVESAFDKLLKIPNRAIVIAAGNDYLRKIHTSGKVSPDTHTDIHWLIPSNPSPHEWELRQELEIWYPKDTSLKVEIIDPNQRTIGVCRLGDPPMISDSNVSPLVLVKNVAPELDLAKNLNHIDILIDNRLPAFPEGGWSIRLSQNQGQAIQNREIEYHAWIELNGQIESDELNKKAGSEFSRDSQREGTINGIGNATLPIVVGSCSIENSQNSFFPLYYSSAGPSLNMSEEVNGRKPELCAPGENITAAKALKDRYDYNGTSVAAPHVTGAIALMFQKALNQNKALKMQDIRRILKITADPVKSANNIPVEYDQRLGFGRVNVLKALKEIDNI